jgi:hypothetical protein
MNLSKGRCLSHNLAESAKNSGMLRMMNKSLFVLLVQQVSL